MSRPLSRPVGRVFRFPRVSGDEPEPATLLRRSEPFSPRERG